MEHPAVQAAEVEQAYCTEAIQEARGYQPKTVNIDYQY
jgi:hypothetical protein